MSVVALILFIAFLVISYIKGKKDLLSPFFLLCLSSLCCYIIVLLNYKNWEITINLNFIIYYFTALSSFGIASFLIKIPSKETLKTENCLIYLPLKQERTKTFYPFYTLIFISFLFSFFYIKKVISDSGEVLSITQTLRKIYDMTVAGYSAGIIYNQMKEIVIAIAYISAYRIFAKLFNKNDTEELIKMLLPIIFFFIVTAVASDRNVYLRFAIYIIALWIVFYYRKHNYTKSNKKIIFFAAIMILAVILIFFLLGKLKNYSSDIFRSISIYSGSGLYDFNLWIANPPENFLLGKSSFYGIIGIVATLLKPFGLIINNTVNRFDERIIFYSSNGYCYDSNIYSALRPFVEDFGYLGVIVMPFILGIIFQVLYNLLKTKDFSLIKILYCKLIYPIIFFPVAEQFFRRLHLGYVYEIFWVVVFYFAIYETKSVLERKNNYSLLKKGKIWNQKK